MGLINVHSVDNISLFQNNTNQFAGAGLFSQTYTTPAMPSVFNYYNPYFTSFSTPSFNCFNIFSNFFNPLQTFTFTPSNFTLMQPSANIFTGLTNLESSSNSYLKTWGLNFNKNKLSLSNVGYNEEKGLKLAQAVKMNATSFKGHCARSVRKALEECGLGTGIRGDGHDYAYILSNNKNFKEISTSNLDLSDLPAGCILVYDKGVAGYSSKYGHVEITLGNGQAASDGITSDIRQGARVFVPV